MGGATPWFGALDNVKSREGRLDGKLVKKQVFDIHSLLFDLDYGYDTTYCLSLSQEF